MSMYLDDDPVSPVATPSGGGQDQFSETAMTGQRVGKHGWKKDSEAPQCMECGKLFTMTFRRHHCRSCGDVFCAMCTNYREVLDNTDQKKKKESRVCYRCSQNYAIDKREPLYRILGEEFGSRYFYGFSRNGYADVSSLVALDTKQRESVYDEMKIPHTHRDAINERLRHVPPGLTFEGLREYFLRPAFDETSSSISASPARSPQPPRSPSRDFSTPVALSNMSPIATPERVQRRSEMSTEELDVQRKHLLDSLRVLDGSITRVQMEYKRYSEERREEEARLGDVRRLHDTLRSTEVYDEHIDDAIDKGLRHAEQETQDRKRLFLKGAHHVSCCNLCNKKYSTFDREHHCRACYRSCCNKCSLQKTPKGERCCDYCKALHVLQSDKWMREVEVDDVFRISVLAVTRQQTRLIQELVVPGGPESFRTAVTPVETRSRGRSAAPYSPPAPVEDLCSASVFDTQEIKTRARSWNIPATSQH